MNDRFCGYYAIQKELVTSVKINVKNSYKIKESVVDPSLTLTVIFVTLVLTVFRGVTYLSITLSVYMEKKTRKIFFFFIGTQ